MVATDQDKQKQKEFLDVLLSSIADKDRLGKAAQGLSGQQMNTQLAPIQVGGGLLQMMPQPQMQYGQGTMGASGGVDYGMGDEKTGVEKLMGLLERLATAGVIG
jgi:hypothetical protein